MKRDRDNVGDGVVQQGTLQPSLKYPNTGGSILSTNTPDDAQCWGGMRGQGDHSAHSASSSMASDNHSGCNFVFNRAFNDFRNNSRAAITSVSLEDDLMQPVSEVPKAVIQSTLKSADTLLVKEMNNMSVTERQEAYEDIHGVESVIEERAEWIQAKLDQFDRELSKLLVSKTCSVTIRPADDMIDASTPAVKTTRVTYKVSKTERAVYERAQFYNPRFVKDVELRLMFIRCEQYDVGLAIVRFIKFLVIKMKIFGPDKLVKTITQDDLDGSVPESTEPSEDSIPFIQQGYMQPLPEKDRSGRPVVMFFNKKCVYRHHLEAARGAYYVIMQVLKGDMVAQIRGVVTAAFECIKANTKGLSFDMGYVSCFDELFSCLPMRKLAVHFCYDDKRILPAMSIVKLIIGRTGRVRFRPHYGTAVECRYHLMTFGIPAHTIPVDEETLTIDMRMYMIWLDMCRQREEEEERQTEARRQSFLSTQKESFEWIDSPTSKDILLGRGKPYQQHDGNLQLHSVINEYWDAYLSAGRSEKNDIFRQIISQLKSSGARFLAKRKLGTGKYDGGPEWQITDDKTAREKVSHAFRNKPIVAKYHSSKADNASSQGDTNQ